MLVTDFLSEHFKDIMDYNFTAKVEEEFDEIAEGKIKWAEMLRKFYGPFHKQVAATANAERQSGEREL
jgi:DNA topoisomerase-1